MKKYFLTLATVTIFAIGFAASDEDGSSNSSSSSPAPQTEQKQESPAEKLAQKKKEVEEKAYKAGYSHGLRQGPVSYSHDNPKDAARIYFNTAYGIPSSSEEKELLNLFLEHYVKGYHDGYKSKEE